MATEGGLAPLTQRNIFLSRSFVLVPHPKRRIKKESPGGLGFGAQKPIWLYCSFVPSSAEVAMIEIKGMRQGILAHFIAHGLCSEGGGTCERGEDKTCGRAPHDLYLERMDVQVDLLRLASRLAGAKRWPAISR